MTVGAVIRRELVGLLDCLLPPACPLCGAEYSPDHGALCEACLCAWPAPASCRCPRCSLPYAGESDVDHLCGACLLHPPPFARVLALGPYEGDLRRAIHLFKFRGRFTLDRTLSRMVLEMLRSEIDACDAGVIVPVPLHRRRLRQRTYNQALLLARQLGKRLGLPVAAKGLLRVRETAAQQGLPAKARRQNLKGAFVAGKGISGRRVLLVDDVMTTGATLAECSRELLADGATEVSALVLGRAKQGVANHF